jgi:hypothetical protein
MIKDISEIIEELAIKGRATIESFRAKENLKHPGTVGDMYEELTGRMIARGIPDNLNIRLVSGFIEGLDGQKSKQIDQMIVFGEGKKIPNLDKYIYPLSQVLATIEVKTHLNAKTLDEGHLNIASYANFQNQSTVDHNIVNTAFKTITRKSIETEDDVKNLSPRDAAIFNTLLQIAKSPVSIIYGHHGYASESTFRNAVDKYWRKQIREKKSLNPSSLPDLIICNDLSIIKLNGMPYGAFSDSHPNHWVMYASHFQLSSRVLLEVLWTRLNSFLRLDDSIYGDDLEIENLEPLVATSMDELNRWEYEISSRSKRSLETRAAVIDWKPVEISSEEAVFLMELKENPNLMASDPVLIARLRAQSIAPHDFFEGLRQKNIVSEQGGYFNSLTKNLVIANLPDGRTLAADDVTGRFSRWVARYINKKKENEG